MDGDLVELLWHWGDAYLIADGRWWTAARYDGRGTLKAATADDLLGKIRADYAACPVPRSEAPVTYLRATS